MASSIPGFTVPITITPIGVGNNVGPGIGVQVQTDFIGPLPSTANWEMAIYQSDGETLVYALNRVDNFNPVTLVLYDALHTQTNFNYQTGVQAGTNVHVVVRLRETATGPVVDEGSTTMVWEPTAQLVPTITSQIAAEGGGFTASDRSQQQAILDGLTVPLQAVGQALTTTVGALLAPFRIDFSPTVNLSGGITCDPVRINLSLAAFYGIKIHVTTIPDDWRFGTPDGDWGFHDLAVLSCWINDDQLVRCGIHTPSFVLTPLPGTATPFISSAIAELQPPGYSVHVDWAPGVCGEVLGINLPV